MKYKIEKNTVQALYGGADLLIVGRFAQLGADLIR